MCPAESRPRAQKNYIPLSVKIVSFGERFLITDEKGNADLWVN
jgi:hypothetical protein